MLVQAGCHQTPDGAGTGRSSGRACVGARCRRPLRPFVSSSDRVLLRRPFGPSDVSCDGSRTPFRIEMRLLRSEPGPRAAAPCLSCFPFETSRSPCRRALWHSHCCPSRVGLYGVWGRRRAMGGPWRDRRFDPSTWRTPVAARGPARVEPSGSGVADPLMAGPDLRRTLAPRRTRRPGRQTALPVDLPGHETESAVAVGHRLRHRVRPYSFSLRQSVVRPILRTSAALE
jgi:hypothetical protein